VATPNLEDSRAGDHDGEQHRGDKAVVVDDFDDRRPAK
jgi:hypothetical protein